MTNEERAVPPIIPSLDESSITISTQMYSGDVNCAAKHLDVVQRVLRAFYNDEHLRVDVRQSPVIHTETVFDAGDTTYTVEADYTVYVKGPNNA